MVCAVLCVCVLIALVAVKVRRLVIADCYFQILTKISYLIRATTVYIFKKINENVVLHGNTTVSKANSTINILYPKSVRFFSPPISAPQKRPLLLIQYFLLNGSIQSSV